MESRHLCALAACLAVTVSALAQSQPPQRLVIQLERPIHPQATPERESALALGAARELARDARYVRKLASGSHVVELPAGTSAPEAAEIARLLPLRDAGIARAEPDR
jgi:hypothetical protein